MDTNYQLMKKLVLRGRITALSGLHIGGSNTGMEIGGINASVIRNPVDNKPYIPGSSLKGKMRSLLHIAEGEQGVKMSETVTKGPCMDPGSITAQLFGNALDKKAEDPSHQKPSHIIVRDCYLQNDDAFFKNTDLDYTQLKTEVVIDRITSAAMPRTMERVPAGASFGLEIIVNVFNEEPSQDFLLQHLFRAMRLLQDDYLGGHGSRGSGQVGIVLHKVWERGRDWYLAPVGEGRDITDSAGIPADLLASNADGHG